MVKIKICGITNFKDAKLASELGADIIGFVFADSKRKIEACEAKKIIGNLHPNIKTAGVFYNQSLDYIRKISNYTGIDIIQLHGDESPAFCEKIKKRVIKRIKISRKTNKSTIISDIIRYKTQYFLLDPGKGDGNIFNWNIAKSIDYPVFIAGGLTSENVLSALQIIKPYGVDVSSGIEIYPGKKDAKKMENFINAVRNI